MDFDYLIGPVLAFLGVTDGHDEISPLTRLIPYGARTRDGADGRPLDGCETYEEFERRVAARAIELTKGMPDAFNIVPTLELVRHAFRMGYDVVKRDGPSPVQS